jgi:DNA repair exonuclease SbcCD ATPase subunit
MHLFRTFPDLRFNARARASETTLWPSFTDIMTVILMVFMLTMVVVILKNAHLLERVKLSQELEQESARKLEAALATQQDLRDQNIDLEEQLRAKEMENILLGEERAQLEDKLASRSAQIERLEKEQAGLRENLRQVELDLTAKNQEIEAAGRRLAASEEASRRRAEELQQQIAALLDQLHEKEAVLVTLTEKASNLELDLARQRQDFSSLEERYLRLVRPARSAVGKHVVIVQYTKDENGPQIRFRATGGSEPEPVTEEELHRRLAALKEQYGDDLYVKIVIPDDSGLSYNEAWRFTKDILSRYDYYYANGW